MKSNNSLVFKINRIIGDDANYKYFMRSAKTFNNTGYMNVIFIRSNMDTTLRLTGDLRFITGKSCDSFSDIFADHSTNNIGIAATVLKDTYTPFMISNGDGELIIDNKDSIVELVLGAANHILPSYHNNWKTSSEAFRDMNSLEVLRLHNTNVIGTTLDFRNLTNIRELTLKNVKGLLLDISYSFNKMAKLTNLNLSKLDSTGLISSLECNPLLNRLIINRCNVHGDIDSLSTLNDLEFLNLSWNNIRGNIESLKGSNKLTNLILSHIPVYGDVNNIRFDLRSIILNNLGVYGNLKSILDNNSKLLTLQISNASVYGDLINCEHHTLNSMVLAYTDVYYATMNLYSIKVRFPKLSKYNGKDCDNIFVN